MWKEFEGQLVNGNGQRATLKIENEKLLSTGDNVFIGKETTGVLRKKVICETSIQVVDDDLVKVTKKRPQESRVTNAGDVTSFGMALQNYEHDEDGKTIPVETSSFQRGMVWESDSKHRVHGVFWVNDEGITPPVVLITPKRVYYKTDKDKDSLEAFKRFKIK